MTSPYQRMPRELKTALKISCAVAAGALWALCDYYDASDLITVGVVVLLTYPLGILLYQWPAVRYFRRVHEAEELAAREQAHRDEIERMTQAHEDELYRIKQAALGDGDLQSRFSRARAMANETTPSTKRFVSSSEGGGRPRDQ